MEIKTDLDPEGVIFMLAMAAKKYGVDGHLQLERKVYDSMSENCIVDLTVEGDDILTVVLNEK